MKIPLSRPDISQDEIKMVNKVLKTPFLSIGPMVQEFERNFAKFTGAKYAAAVSSGTAGLHLALRALNIGPGDEVITSPFSFIASANSILFQNAVPVFVDIDPVSWNIDPLKIEKAISPRTKAILPVHVFGQPCEMEAIMSIAKKHNLYVIEDACESFGAIYEDKHSGTIGDIGVFGFYPNKQITTGEGGMVITNNRELLYNVMSLRNQGRPVEGGKWLEHTQLGYNYRLDEMSAALGIAQLRRAKKILQMRQDIADLYKESIDNIEGIEILPDLPGTLRSWFVYVVKLASDVKRADVIAKLTKRGIDTGTYFPCIHLQPFYKQKFGYKEGSFPVAEQISRSTLALPFHNKLTRKEINFIADTLISILER
ncbi:MAG: DegT/DnrJ/EryC1/StrS family aminotransferase [Planctomycetes bacterium]|nr:DegT/DnrJ/EryC1/StrS family aminotransferase [Planctomycetota bacterium]